MALEQNYLADEQTLLRSLIPLAKLTPAASNTVAARARALIEEVRAEPANLSALDRMLSEYDLGSEEGVLLMCLAESFVRIPDSDTANELIADKLGQMQWAEHLHGDDMFVNASTWALMLGGKIVSTPALADGEWQSLFHGLIARLGEPIIRSAIRHAMAVLAEQFVMGDTIDSALQRAAGEAHDFESFSFDMLGEAALSKADASAYFDAYATAIKALAAADDGQPARRPRGISVKLSALYPRFEITHAEQAVKVLSEKLAELITLAAAGGVNLTVDAEESERLAMTLAVFENVVRMRPRDNWQGLGIAVQAYQKRALDVILRITELANTCGNRLRVRLVKGAYWDSEIKMAQTRGLGGFPVFTVKHHTDISYMACARVLLDHHDKIEPLFATHNAYTVAYIEHLAAGRAVEFQRLHGMGEALYEAFSRSSELGSCTVYAPVGEQKSLLPYLIRRLLENGANTSFVHRIADPMCPIETLVASPISLAQSNDCAPHPKIKIPHELFRPRRDNSVGTNFANDHEQQELLLAVHENAEESEIAKPIVAGKTGSGVSTAVYSPANPARKIGEVVFSDSKTLADALHEAANAEPHRHLNANERAGILDQAADLMSEQRAALISIAVHECGRTIIDAHDEVREAIDFCRYYAALAREQFAAPVNLPGPAGEHNSLEWRALGVIACISPWNFPISIFAGQIAGAFAAGNAVIAKPSEYASLTAQRVINIFYAAGVPSGALSFLPGLGGDIGGAMVSDARVDGVAFTGATVTADHIREALLAREGPAARLIAETGGINAMVVDSSAMPEQVVLDVTASGFNSAGQRCSSLRALYLQADIAVELLDLLCAHLAELTIGDPMHFDTDIGPLINAAACERLENYIDEVSLEGRLLYRGGNLPVTGGHYFAPCVVAIDDITQIPANIFGPVVHVCEFESQNFEQVCAAINDSDYALTFGIHSRIDTRIDYFVKNIRAGNIYVNRNMIGAVVGSQPFGGHRLSGTGPKAGGPNYLRGFASEHCVSTNIAAAGGNASLLALD